MENIPHLANLDPNITKHPSNAASKRTLSNASEKRYRDSASSLLEEISVNVSTEKPLERSNSNPEKAGPPMGPEAKPTLPAFYHSRHRSCHQRKPSLLMASGQKTEQEAIEEIKANSRSTMNSVASEEPPTLRLAAHHVPQNSTTSHTRTASDYDSVILIGQDDSMMATSMAGSTDTLTAIFEMIDAAKPEGLVITPGQITLSPNDQNQLDNTIVTEIKQYTEEVEPVNTDGRDTFNRTTDIMKSQFFDPNVRASTGEFIVNPVLPYCPKCYKRVQTKVVYIQQEMTFFQKLVKQITDSFCQSCSHVASSRKAIHRCVHCRTVVYNETTPK